MAKKRRKFLKTCQIEGCDKAYCASKWGANICQLHYSRLWRRGSLEIKTLQERFEEKYVKQESGCWEWIAGFRNKLEDYGCFRNNKVSYFAHRFSYELYIGPIPEGLCVCHKCDNPRCVNPDHMFLGTRKDNNMDMMQKGRYGKHAKLGYKSAQKFAKV